MKLFGLSITRAPDPSSAGKALSDIARANHRARIHAKLAELRQNIADGHIAPLGWPQTGAR